jgi:hypothetical protein
MFERFSLTSPPGLQPTLCGFACAAPLAAVHCSRIIRWAQMVSKGRLCTPGAAQAGEDQVRCGVAQNTGTSLYFAWAANSTVPHAVQITHVPMLSTCQQGC